MGYQERLAKIREAGAGEGPGGAAAAVATEEKKSPGAAEGEAGGAAGGEGAAGEGAGDGKDSGGIQARIGELTTEKKMAERQAALYARMLDGEQPTRSEFAAAGVAYRQVHAAGQAEGGAEKKEGAAAQKPPPFDGTDPTDPRPRKEAYRDESSGDVDDVRYEDDLLEWNTRKAQRRAERAAADKEHTSKQEQIAVELDGKIAAMIEAGAAKYADFREVTSRRDVAISEQMAVALLESGAAAEIAYHLGTHPEEARRIYDLPPAVQSMEIGTLRDRFKAEAAGGEGAGEGAAGAGEGGGAADAEKKPAPGAAANGGPEPRKTKAPAAPSQSPSGAGAGSRRPKSGTPEAVAQHRREMKEKGLL